VTAVPSLDPGVRYGPLWRKKFAEESSDERFNPLGLRPLPRKSIDEPDEHFPRDKPINR